jgi:beta-glucosidase
MTAIEQRAVGIPWNFMPVLDVARQPLWSRFYECLGESPYVVSVLGEEYVKGSQGDGNLANNDNVAVCLKHFIGWFLSFNLINK